MVDIWSISCSAWSRSNWNPFRSRMWNCNGAKTLFGVWDQGYTLSSPLKFVTDTISMVKVRFTSLTIVMVMDYPNVNRKRITTNNFTEAMPLWNPEWNLIGVFTLGPETRMAVILYKAPSWQAKKQSQSWLKNQLLYVAPVWSPDNRDRCFSRTRRELQDAEVGVL